MRRKIGIFTGYFLPHLGGVERYTDKIASVLRAIGYELVIVTTNDGSQDNYERDDTYTIYRLPIHDMAKERYPIPRVNNEYKELIKQIEGENIDTFIVQTRFHLTSLVGARMAKRQKKPVMLIEHGTDHFSVGNKTLDFFGSIYEHILTLMIKRLVDRYYGVSQNCNKWLGHFSIKASGVFYNAVSSKDQSVATNTYEKRYPKNEIIITYAGRLIKEKGVLNLLDAFKNLSNTNVRLVIAGDGELMDAIKRDYQTKNISILGKLNFQQVMSLYKRTDIFVYPSLYPEGLPTSILEAGLMECALVATPRGGTEEVIIDNDHGIIVDGTVGSLQVALETLAINGELRKKQAKNAKKRVQEYFEWGGVAKRVDKEIKELEKSNHE